MTKNRPDPHSDDHSRAREREAAERPQPPDAQDESAIEAFEEEGAGIAAKE